MVYDKHGKLIFLGKGFEEEIAIIDLDEEYEDKSALLLKKSQDIYESIYNTLVL